VYIYIYIYTVYAYFVAAMFLFTSPLSPTTDKIQMLSNGILPQNVADRRTRFGGSTVANSKVRMTHNGITDCRKLKGKKHIGVYWHVGHTKLNKHSYNDIQTRVDINGIQKPACRVGEICSRFSGGGLKEKQTHLLDEFP
jgi:hypothetical protein